MPEQFSEEQSEQIAKERNTANAKLAKKNQKRLAAILLLMLEECEYRILKKQYPIPLDSQTRWARNLAVGQTIEGSMAANAGYASAASLMQSLGLGSRTTGQVMFSLYQDAIAKHFEEQGRIQATTYARHVAKSYHERLGETENGRPRYLYDDEGLAEAVMSDMKAFNATYSELLAQTAMVWASNEGVIKKYKESGVRYIRWYTVLDERVCPSCMALHGTVVGIDMPFVEANGTVGDTGLKLPPWPTMHPPLHNRCRCVTLVDMG
jgi:SPP1 gp7 family putative phage head morphogenesis protein